MYVNHCKLATNKQLKSIEYFVAAPARTGAELASIHRKAAIRFFLKSPEKIAPSNKVAKLSWVKAIVQIYARESANEEHRVRC